MKRTQKILFYSSLNRRAALTSAVAIAIIGGIIGLHVSNAAIYQGPRVVSTSGIVLPYGYKATEAGHADDHDHVNAAATQARGFYKVTGGECGDLFEIRDSSGVLQGCSHGFDSASDYPTAKSGISGDAVAEPTPLTGDQLLSPNNITCDGDGQAGKRVQAMYVRAQSQASKYTAFSASFQEYIRRTNLLILKSSLFNGGEARTIHFVTDSNCKVSVPEVVIPDGSETDFGNTVAALKNLGYNQTDRKYMILIDHSYTAETACGLSTFFEDDQPGQANKANVGPTYGATGSDCWAQGTAAHELLHNLGAVAATAPHSDGAVHCTDAFDRMCRYKTVTPLNYVCKYSHQQLFDCNNDDYFNSATSIPTSNYLSNHWNLANSVFLVRGGTPDSIDRIKPDPPVFKSPLPNGTVSDANFLFGIQAFDNVGISKVGFKVDAHGESAVTDTLYYSTGEPAVDDFGIRYDLSSLANGTHNITAIAYDLDGNTSSTSITFNFTGGTTTPPPTPPPTTPPPTTPPPTTPPPTTPPPTPPGKTGDLNGDTKVNITDLSILLSNFGKAGPVGDLNKSGKVDITDLSILLSNWGK